MKDEAKSMRTGFTTGSAAAAGAVAAFLGGREEILLLLPGGRRLAIPIAASGDGWAEVRKDGGDDPDVTSGLVIRVELKQGAFSPSEVDYVEEGEGLSLVVSAGEGVGRVTHPGLSVPVGKWAINPTPRKMLWENLLAVGCRGEWRCVISVEGGAEVAAKTLNPALGIVGGISILGNSGIVYPYSNAAYAATIALQVRSLAASGETSVAFVTGGRSEEAILRAFPSLPKGNVIRIADFIYVAMKAAQEAGMRRVIVGCLPGKLLKYACGERNTHAHQCALHVEKLREWGIVQSPSLPLEKFSTMGELQCAVSPQEWQRILEALRPRAQAVLQSWAPSCEIVLPSLV